MKDKEIDEILKQAAQAPHDVDPAVLDQVAKSIGSSLRPVRPPPPAWVLTTGMVSICIAVALAGAAKAGFLGVENLTIPERAVIFPSLGILIWMAAGTCVGEMTPGSRRRIAPGTLLGFGWILLLAVFAALFHDYRTDDFVSAGLVCLRAGLLVAIPAGFLGWLILRRGFAVNSIAAGLAGGTFAGLAGLTMLEFHCPQFQAPHVMLWHVAVVPISGAVGALLGWVLRSRAVDGTRKPASPKTT